VEKEFSNRRRLRLENFNYAANGAYFITTCTQNREDFFGEIKNKKMILNECGKIVQQKWLWLSKQYSYVNLDEFVVMPDHFHGILIINSIFGENFQNGSQFCDSSHFCRGGSRPAPTKTIPNSTVKIKPITELIGAFKTTSSKQIHQSVRPDFQWQRSFFDHIIRNEEELSRIRNYIRLNPLNWDKDKDFHPDL
jgi:putative transposase